MLSSIFIQRPRLAFVISIVILVAGVIAYFALPVAQFPDIVPPQVQVTALYPGADAGAVEQAIGQIVEPAVNGVEKMLYMKSTSGADGSYSLLVSFEVGSNPDLDAVNVSNRVNQIMSQLPPESQRLGVTVKKKSAAMVQVVTFHSPDGSKDALFLSNYATINALDALARVPGVGEAVLFGPLDYSMRIWLDIDRLASLGLTTKDVVTAVQAQNVQAAVGRIGAAPLVNAVDFQFNLTAQGRLVTVPGIREHHRPRERQGRAGARQGCGAGRAGRQGQRLRRRGSTASRRRASASIRRPAPTPSRPRMACARCSKN